MYGGDGSRITQHHRYRRDGSKIGRHHISKQPKIDKCIEHMIK